MIENDIMVCLASAQTIPNILPAVDPAFKPKKKLIVLATAKMKERAEWIQKCVQSTLDVEIISITDDEFDHSNLEKQFFDVCENYSDSKICLNITGGTKLMALIALNVFSSFCDTEVIYVPDGTSVINIKEQKSTLFPISYQLKLREYLQAYGYCVINYQNNVESNHRSFIDFMINNIEAKENKIGALNYLCNDDKSSLTIRDEQKQVCEILEELGYSLVQTDDEVTWKFVDEVTKSFAGGVWFEEYTYLELNKLKDFLQDFAFSVEVRGPNNSKNEIDAAFIYKNKLYIIECKTAEMKKSNKGVDILHKLESIKDLTGGVQAKGILLSFRKPRVEDYDRAKDLRVEIVSGSSLKNLSAKLKSYLT